VIAIRKKRADARLERLPAEQQVELVRFAESHTLDEAVVWLRERGVRISRTALANWLEGRRMRDTQERILRSIASGAQLMRECEREYGKNPAPTVEQLIRLFRTLVMQIASAGACDPEFLRAAAPMMGQVLEAERLAVKRQELMLEERRVAVLERRAAQAEAAQGVVQDGALSAEEKMAKMREIFGIKS
jgi:hypothetical protein